MSDKTKVAISNTMSSNWRAWVNMMPGTPPVLHVVGSIDVGNESDSASIIFDSLEKSNPPNLVLRIIYKTIYIPRDPGDTEVLLHYSQASMPGQIGKIIVVYPDGSNVEIDHISIAH